jgi:hypothetical protein
VLLAAVSADHRLDDVAAPRVEFGAVMAGRAILSAVCALLAQPFSASLQALRNHYLGHYDVVDSPLKGSSAQQTPRSGQE